MAREDKRVREITDRYNDGTTDILDLQQRTWEARSYLAGQQWIGWDVHGTELRPLQRHNTRVRATVNRIGPDSRRIIAKLTSKQLRFEVHPTTPDDAARRAASLSESVLASAHREQDWETVRQDHAWSTWEGGTALIAVDWDPSKGTALDAQGRRKVGTGDVCLSVVSITEAATIPGTRDIRFAPWWIRAQALPPEEVKAAYDLDELPATDATATNRYLRRSLSAGRRNETTRALTRVLTYYERPLNGSKGQVLTVVGDKIVQEAEWPFPFTDRLNVAVAKTVHIPGRWSGHAVCWDAIEPQTLYNQSWSTLIEHAKHAGNARIAVPYGAVEDPEELSDQPGEFLEYNPGLGGGPEWMSPPQLPQWLLTQPEKIAEQLDDILGVHDVSRGVAPRNIESGIGLAILDENDSTPIGAFARELANCWSDVGRMVLRIYEKRVTETRNARVVEPGVPPMLEKWNGKDLMGQTDAQVPVDSFTPLTKASKQQLAIQVADRYPEQVDFKKFCSLAELDPGVVDTIDPQTGRAERELRDLVLGIERLVHPDDDDERHLATHIAFLQSQRYELLPDDRKEMIDMHIQAHRTQMAEKAAASDAQNAMSPTLGAVPPSIGPEPMPPEMPPEGMDPMMPPEPAPMPGMEMSDQLLAQEGIFPVE